MLLHRMRVKTPYPIPGNLDDIDRRHVIVRGHLYLITDRLIGTNKALKIKRGSVEPRNEMGAFIFDIPQIHNLFFVQRDNDRIEFHGRPCKLAWRRHSRRLKVAAWIAPAKTDEHHAAVLCWQPRP